MAPETHTTGSPGSKQPMPAHLLPMMARVKAGDRLRGRLQTTSD